MRWLWFVGPLIVLLLLLWVSIWPGREENRLRAEVTRWLDELLGPLRTKKGDKGRRVRKIPDLFHAMVEAIGGGTRITDAVLVPSVAYVVVRAADNVRGSNHVTVLLKLDKLGPGLSCRPLPIVDGRLADNRGVIFEGDDLFRDSFEVVGDNPTAIKKWLRPDLREALLELPEVWLRVDRDVLALTLYGCPDADQIDQLVDVADAFCADKGATSESLFGAEPKAKQKPRTDEPAIVTSGFRGKPAEVRKPEPPLTAIPPDVRLKATVVDVGLYLAAVLFVAATLGALESFHPQVFFASPDKVVDEPWQGGFTTKGFGAFTAALALILGLIAWQSYLGARGRSLGKLLFGARVVREDGGRAGFYRGVALRTWLFAAMPLLVAAARARPFSARSFFFALPHWSTAVVAVVLLVVALATALRSADGRGIHDRIARTKVVAAEPYRLPSVQLGVAGLDPVVFRRILGLGAVTVAYVGVNLIGWLANKGLWYDWVF
jgi:uncharacterized RDD family membrane protein YckC